MTTEQKTAAVSNPAVRHEFVLLFDVTNGNPNGDPDAANAPRTDPETQLGFVTDVAIKRKVRDYLLLSNSQRPNPIDIFIQSKTALNTSIETTSKTLSPELSSEEKSGKKSIPRLRDAMCGQFYDIRMFGAVLSTGKLNAGQVRGPVQVTFARSIDRVLPIDVTITRQARTTEERMETGGTEIGRKSILPYGLYRAHGFFNPLLGRATKEGGTGVSADDLQLFWQALTNLFDLDRSASRGEMAVRGLYVFSHENALGKAPAHKLFKLIKVPSLGEGAAPRSFEEYENKITHPAEGMLEAYPGVTLTVLAEG